MSDQSKLGIGKPITSEQHRDAIHVAVAPVRAAHILKPGDHVGLNEKQEAVTFAKPIGIVDPFLMETVQQGNQFWLFLYPGSITSLRHEWEHSAFSGSPQPVQTSAAQQLIDIAEELDITLNCLLKYAGNWLEDGDYFTEMGSEHMRSTFNPDKFWPLYEEYTGIKVPHTKKESFFSCSC